MFPEKALLQALLAEKSALLFLNAEAIHDYQSLKIRIINEELKNEIHKLQSLILADSIESMQQQFLRQCKKRAKCNADSCLSLAAMPRGVCNELFWQIAHILFKPKTLGEMLNILLPQVTTELRYEVELIGRKSSAESKTDLQFKFKEGPILSLEEPPELHKLSNVVISGALIFDLNSIATFNFKLHQKFYEALQQRYPLLGRNLYQHNSHLKTLLNHLLLARNEGQRPYEVMKHFINELRLGGQQITGQFFASIEARVAHIEFLSYLLSLPPALKDQLLDLKDGTYGRTSLDVLNALDHENCVETAASNLQQILDNKANHPILMTAQTLTPKQLQEIRRFYGSGDKPKSLVISGNNPTIFFPYLLLKKNLKQVIIPHWQDYLSFLLSFPPNHYQFLFKFAQICCVPPLPEKLGQLMANGAFNREQLSALNQAIAANSKKLGGIHRILQFAIQHKNHELLIKQLTAVSPPARLSIIKEKDSHGDTVLHQAANKLPILKTILELLLFADRLSAIKEKNHKGLTVLHPAATNPEVLKFILPFYPDTERLAVIKEKNTHGQTVLHKAASNLEAVKTILELLPVRDRLSAIKAKNMYDFTLLHWSADVPQALDTILHLLPEVDRLAAVKEKNNHGTVLHYAADNPESLGTVLCSLANSERMPALKVENRYGATVFNLVKNSGLQAIFLSLSSNEKLWDAYLCLCQEAGPTPGPTLINLLISLANKEIDTESSQGLSFFAKKGKHNLLNKLSSYALNREDFSLIAQVFLEVGGFEYQELCPNVSCSIL